MPVRGSKKKADYWKKDNPDTGETLKFIHLQRSAGATPLVEDFLGTPVGKALVAKWGAGDKSLGEKKVKYNFKSTLTRHTDWADGSGSQGTTNLTISFFYGWLISI